MYVTYIYIKKENAENIEITIYWDIHITHNIYEKQIFE